MNDNIKVGNFTADGGLINLPLGYIPDYFQLHNVGEGTNPNMYQWFRAQEQVMGTTMQEGMITTGTSGIVTLAAADAGIIAYDTGAEAPSIATWTQTLADAAAAGAYFKASVASDADRGSIFELTTAGTGTAVEPTWPEADGATVTDGTNVFTKVNVSKQRIGYQGVVIQDNIQTDGEENFYLALKAIQSIDHGDVDGWTDGIDSDA
jgi:hypothetical protein